MKIQVVGAGAMGLVLAYFLSKKNEVCIKVREGTKEYYHHVEVIIDGKRERLSAEISERFCEADITIIALKSYDLPSISSARIKGDVIFIQNGLSHLNYKIGERNFYAVTTWAAKKVSKNVAELTGRGYFRVGSPESHLDLTFLRESGINAQWTDDIRKELFRKAGINAVINTITSIYGVNNGALYEEGFINYISKLVSDEITILYKSMGIDLNVYEDAMETARITSRNISSMLQDISNHRRTEIDAITGELLNYSKEFNVKIPLNFHLYQVIKSLESQKG